MKTIKDGIIAGILGMSCAMIPNHAKADGCRSIVDLASTTPTLSTLVTAVQAAGLVEQLSGPGSYTVLAPTNDAFQKIPSATLANLLKDRKALRQVLLGHVANSEIDVDTFTNGSAGGRTLASGFDYDLFEPTVVMANGKTLNYGTFSNDGGPERFNFTGFAFSNKPAQVVQADIEACNGLIHIIDNVLQ